MAQITQPKALPGPNAVPRESEYLIMRSSGDSCARQVFRPPLGQLATERAFSGILGAKTGQIHELGVDSSFSEYS